jgi:hypothetical protein
VATTANTSFILNGATVGLSSVTVGSYVGALGVQAGPSTFSAIAVGLSPATSGGDDQGDDDGGMGVGQGNGSGFGHDHGHGHGDSQGQGWGQGGASGFGAGAGLSVGVGASIGSDD